MAVNTDDRMKHAVILTDREFRHLFAERFRKIADVNSRKTPIATTEGKTKKNATKTPRNH